MNDNEYQNLIAENASSPTAIAAIKQLRGALWTPDTGGFCLKFARMAVEKGHGLADGATYTMAPGIHTGRYAGDVGDAFYRQGWAIAVPQCGDLVFQRGVEAEMDGKGALISPPWGHVGVVIVHNGELWVAHNTLAVHQGLYIANRADVAINNRMVPLDQWGDYVAIRIPPEKLGGKCDPKPSPKPTAPTQTVWLDGVDITGKRVVLPSGTIINAEVPNKVQIKS